MMYPLSIVSACGTLGGMSRPLKDLIQERIDTAYGGNQAAFARALGIKPQTLGTWLRGKSALPQIDARRRLARELGLTHIEVLVAAGELAEEEAAIPDDPRSDAVRRLQPMIDEIEWNEYVYRRVEDHLRFVRDAQRGELKVPD